MRTYRTPALPGTSRLLRAVLASTLVACAESGETGLTHPRELLVPAPVSASVAATQKTNPNLPVYLEPRGRTVSYRKLLTQHRQWVDQALVALAAYHADYPTGCTTHWVDNGVTWGATCYSNGHTCNIDHGPDGHTTKCYAGPPG